MSQLSIIYGKIVNATNDIELKSVNDELTKFQSFVELFDSEVIDKINEAQLLICNKLIEWEKKGI